MKQDLLRYLGREIQGGTYQEKLKIIQKIKNKLKQQIFNMTEIQK